VKHGQKIMQVKVRSGWRQELTKDWPTEGKVKKGRIGEEVKLRQGGKAKLVGGGPQGGGFSLPLLPLSNPKPRKIKKI